MFPIDSYIPNVKYKYILGITGKFTMFSSLEGVYEFLATVFVAGFTFHFVLVNQTLAFQKDFYS